jgi:hypothetical protein
MSEAGPDARPIARQRRWALSFWLMFFVIIAFGAAVIVNESQTFTNCVHNEKNRHQYQSFKEHAGVVLSPRLIIREWTRLQLIAVCSAGFAQRFNGALVALATIALSVFTFTLWRATAGMWHIGQRQARDLERSIQATESLAVEAKRSADAAMTQAQIAERSFYDLERPYVFITDIRPTPQFLDYEHEEGKAVRRVFIRVQISYAFNNHGRTPAIIYEINFCMRLFVDLPAHPEYGEDTIMRGENIIGTNAQTLTYTTVPIQFSPEEQQRMMRCIEEEKRRFFFYGYVEYRDVFGNKYRRGHGFMYVPKLNVVSAAGGTAYNYDHKISGHETN